MNKHTPGPWEFTVNAHPNAEGYVFCSIWARGMNDSDCNVARTFQPSAVSHAQVLANAHLISAAPEMLEALKHAERVMDHAIATFGMPEEHAKPIRAAIARATGGADE